MAGVNVLSLLRDRDPSGHTVGWLLGGDWPTNVRILHPSWSLSDPDTVVSWRRVADERGVDADLGVASWPEVSGQNPHRSDGGYAYPQEGPDAFVLPRVIASLATAFPAAEYGFAEWAGYGDARPGREVSGLTLQGIHPLGREQFTVWTGRDLTPATLEPPTGLRANYLWSLDGACVVASEEDLTSTYVGLARDSVPWDPDLEAVVVVPATPFS